MANVIITIGNNGTDIPEEIIALINAMISSNIQSACTTMYINSIEYIVNYSKGATK